MAPGKKQKKSKSKRSKDSPSGLVSKDHRVSFHIWCDHEKFNRDLCVNFQSHIASTLVPSAIFAAVPRTPSNLAQTWPRRTPSPIVQALGEAGNIGRVLIGDLSKRPPAELPVSQGERDGNVPEQNDREERLVLNQTEMIPFAWLSCRWSIELYVLTDYFCSISWCKDVFFQNRRTCSFDRTANLSDWNINNDNW
jgi:hypothetical protein